ncbi:NAD-dependent epimerase/dehydratase family protein [Aquirufa antheringensis]|uniref:NAD-dependent epimerase/dehydratase family protein n=1 Tax=Aquirufa antheringensis TaxID=2516559 RepID=UPI0022A99F39|nr:NAD-dependent epimerase/dehydratase family protein [Aquirufa antheringensis]MCZ2490040.1 epimerase [Aquirufa antheringensis]
MENPQIKVIVTGVTGMVGEGVMLEALRSPFVKEVLAISRKPSGHSHPKLKEYFLADFYQPEEIKEVAKDYDACLFCLGVSSVGMKEEEFRRKTYDLTLGFAAQMPKNISFSYISGMSTDSTEKGSIMWARVKGKTENDLKKMGFRDSYSFRPGYLQPMKGNKFTLKYYKYIDWMYPQLLLVAGKTASTLEELAKAMIEVAAFPTEKKTIEVVDIKALAEQMNHRI